jgi:hypothetical protein
VTSQTVPHSYRMTREEIIARLEALAEHLTPDVLDASNNAAWREACRDGAALLRGPESEAVKLLRRCHDAGDLVTALDETLRGDVAAFLGCSSATERHSEDK